MWSLISLELKLIFPGLTPINPFIVLRNILFPAPLGPKIAKIDLLLILQLILSKILVLPNKRDKLEITIGVNDFDFFCLSNIHSPFCSGF